MEINKKVLIVEDEVAMLKALADKFEKAGFMVLTASDGEDGLTKATNEHPHLILLDIIMPKKDGLSVLKAVRQQGDWGSDVQIIMLTNLNDPDSVSEAALHNVFDFLVKTDWRLDDIVNLAKNKLGIES